MQCSERVDLGYGEIQDSGRGVESASKVKRHGVIEFLRLLADPGAFVALNLGVQGWCFENCVFMDSLGTLTACKAQGFRSQSSTLVHLGEHLNNESAWIEDHLSRKAKVPCDLLSLLA